MKPAVAAHSSASTRLGAMLRAVALSVVVFLALACPMNRAAAQEPAANASPAAVAGPVVVAPQEARPNSDFSRSSSAGQDTLNDQAARRAQERTDQQRAAQALPPPPLSEFQRLVESTSGRVLPIFGASIFQGVPSTFAPVTDVPVGPGYLIGPGDELDLQLSGQVNQQIRLTVDRTGAIALPGLGAIHVAGLSYGQLPAFLNAQLGKIYRNFSLNVNLGSLRTIQVFVTGEARQPGSYSISSLSTLLNAVFASGGPLPQGSLRDIQVKRDGRTIDHLDLYDLLLQGDKTHDIPLQTGDVIFIPVVGPQVAVLGSVHVPAIYELKGPTSAEAGLALAGGETSVADSADVRLERVFDHAQRSIRDVSASSLADTLLRNGDILSVGPILDRFRNAVTLRGNVANPGRYVWHPGMRLSDLIPNKESLITRNYWQRRNELGRRIEEYQPATSATPSPTQGALQLSSGANVAGGEVAPSTASGTPQNPGGSSGGSSVGAALTGNSGPFQPKNDVILSAPDIDWSYAVIERQNSKDLTTSLIPFNLGKLVLDGDPSQNYQLEPGDVVTIFSTADVRVPTSQQTRFVRLEGEFVAAGVYSVEPGETLRDLVRRAGGFTPDAYLYASEFTRESTRRVEQQRLREYADELSAQISAVTSTNQARAVSPADQQAAVASEVDARQAVARLRNVQPIGRIVLDFTPDSSGIDSVPALALEDGDRFIVPRVPSSITVEGQVYNANAFLYVAHQRAIDYLHRAGGPDREADKKRIFILRADGSVISRQYADVNKSIVYPGDTIVIPPIIDKRNVFQRIIDIAQIVGNLGTGLGTLVLIATQ